MRNIGPVAVVQTALSNVIVLVRFCSTDQVRGHVIVYLGLGMRYVWALAFVEALLKDVVVNARAGQTHRGRRRVISHLRLGIYHVRFLPRPFMHIVMLVGLGPRIVDRKIFLSYPIAVPHVSNTANNTTRTTVALKRPCLCSARTKSAV